VPPAPSAPWRDRAKAHNQSTTHDLAERVAEALQVSPVPNAMPTPLTDSCKAAATAEKLLRELRGPRGPPERGDGRDDRCSPRGTRARSGAHRQGSRLHCPGCLTPGYSATARFCAWCGTTLVEGPLPDSPAATQPSAHTPNLGEKSLKDHLQQSTTGCRGSPSRPEQGVPQQGCGGSSSNSMVPWGSEQHRQWANSGGYVAALIPVPGTSGLPFQAVPCNGVVVQVADGVGGCSGAWPWAQEQQWYGGPWLPGVSSHQQTSAPSNKDPAPWPEQAASTCSTCPAGSSP